MPRPYTYTVEHTAKALGFGVYGLSQRKEQYGNISEIRKYEICIDGWMHFAALMNEIYRKENAFNAKLYGYNNPSSIFKNVEKNGKKVFTLKLIAGAAQIKLNQFCDLFF